jgi:pyruvate dehydrogenase E2 component (dihydrolipoamide acetyltransferase)
MAEIVRMPKLSDTMTDGVVAAWHKNVGDTVSSGDLLAEIETDKATMEFESFQDGVLLYQGIEVGKTAPIDSILAILGEKGEDVQALLDAEKAKVIEDVVEEKEEVAAPAKSTPASQADPIKKDTSVSPPVPVSSSSNGRMKASPLAKKLAAEKGLDLKIVKGTGDAGRIIKRDIDNFSGGQGMTMGTQIESYTDEPVSQMRKTIARRLGESKFTAPHFYLTMSIDMDRMMDARKAINEVASIKISFNDIVIKACAVALKENPKVNSAWMGDYIRYNEHVHIGVAVAVDDGLLVPVVRFADTKSLTSISAEVRNYAQRAHDKKLQPEDWEGNTFTISNLGMFGIEEFTAIVNSPDSCIMAIGGISEVPVVKEGQIVPGNVMKVTLSCDHRVVDGVTGSKFLQTFKRMMENPILLLGAYSI